MIELVGSTADCGRDCPELLAFWVPWWQEKSARPVALLETGPYLERVDQKTRNMVRKARRLYGYREFSYNEHLRDMYAVNTSKRERQGRPMSASYRVRPEPTSVPEHCVRHRIAWIGGFCESTLVAYCQLVILNELGVVNRILSHGQASAAMNGLIAYLAEEIPVRFIHYLTLRNSRPGLRAFKEHAGFREVSLAIP